MTAARPVCRARHRQERTQRAPSRLPVRAARRQVRLSLEIDRIVEVHDVEESGTTWYRLKAGEPCQGSLQVGTGCAGGWSREGETRGKQQYFRNRDNETGTDSAMA